MTTNFLEKLFRHNHWATLEIIQTCMTLTDEQLDAPPQSATYGSIRSTLLHMIAAQRGYLRILTLPYEVRLTASPQLLFEELNAVATTSGEGFIELTRDPSKIIQETQIRTKDDYWVDAWVVMLQAINHAGEHREQISSMLTALGVTPPRMDGWGYGEVMKATIPMAT